MKIAKHWNICLEFPFFQIGSVAPRSFAMYL